MDDDMSRMIVRLRANELLQEYALSNCLPISVSIQYQLQVTRRRAQEASLASAMHSTLSLTCTVTSGTATSETTTLLWNASAAKSNTKSFKCLINTN